MGPLSSTEHCGQTAWRPQGGVPSDVGPVADRGPYRSAREYPRAPARAPQSTQAVGCKLARRVPLHASDAMRAAAGFRVVSSTGPSAEGRGLSCLHALVAAQRSKEVQVEFGEPRLHRCKQALQWQQARHQTKAAHGITLKGRHDVTCNGAQARPSYG
jgi:hypothetical protein